MQMLKTGYSRQFVPLRTKALLQYCVLPPALVAAGVAAEQSAVGLAAGVSMNAQLGSFLGVLTSQSDYDKWRVSNKPDQLCRNSALQLQPQSERP